MKPCEGTCKHYGRVNYEKKFCTRCCLWFLRCPKCRPSYCPICLEDLRVKREKKEEKQIAYYKRRRQPRRHGSEIKGGCACDEAIRLRNNVKLRSKLERILNNE